MRRTLRKVHRWLGLLMAIQIISWMVSGLYFALFPIEVIRGEHLAATSSSTFPQNLSGVISVERAWNRVAEAVSGNPQLEEMRISANEAGVRYRIEGNLEGKSFVRVVDAFSGEVADRLDEEGAIRWARRGLNVDGVLERVTWVSEAEPGSEYRGRRLPLWRVSFREPEGLRVYVDPWTGETVARRTTRWRVFDFLWMLHIMDFDARDDFNTLLLQTAAGLGLLIAVTGVLYWSLTTRVFRRTKPPAFTGRDS